MAKKIEFINKKNVSSIWTLETLIALLLAVLILFDIKIEKPIRDLINTPIGIISSLLFTILLFIFLHPVIGLLFIIYLYETIIKTKTTNGQNKKNDTLNLLNHDLQETQVEEEVIDKKAPIINKNKNNNVSYKPYLEKDYSIF